MEGQRDSERDLLSACVGIINIWVYTYASNRPAPLMGPEEIDSTTLVVKSGRRARRAPAVVVSNVLFF